MLAFPWFFSSVHRFTIRLWCVFLFLWLDHSWGAFLFFWGYWLSAADPVSFHSLRNRHPLVCHSRALIMSLGPSPLSLLLAIAVWIDGSDFATVSSLLKVYDRIVSRCPSEESQSSCSLPSAAWSCLDILPLCLCSDQKYSPVWSGLWTVCVNVRHWWYS